MSSNIIFTGFEPFGSDFLNPSWEAVKRLPDEISLPGEIGGCRVRKILLPVVFKRAADTLIEVIEKVEEREKEIPAAVICVGLAGGRSAITPEIIAVNMDHARISDNDGQQPQYEKIAEDGPAGLFTRLPVQKIVDAISAEGIAASPSFHAGTFVCNDLMYRLLYYLEEKHLDIPAGFIHVPYMREMPGHENDATAMLLGEIVRGLEQVIPILLDSRK